MEKNFRQNNFRTLKKSDEGQHTTRVGQFIRNYSLDHLPQLFNILLGDINIIGPRLMRPEQVDMDNPIYEKVLQVKPGMFCPGILQLGHTYNASEFNTKLTLELAYLDKRTLKTDLSIFRRMIQATIQSHGNIKMRGKPLVMIERENNQSA